MMQPRVVSLLPSATEIVCGVGAFGHLVGVSHECDHPPKVVGLPVLTQPRLRSRGGSAAIDRSVHGLLRQALAVYELDTERLAGLRPDVVVTQDLCEVCAVPFGEVRRALETLADKRVDIVRLNPRRLGDIWGDIRRVGTALARQAEAEDLIGRLQARVDEVARRAAACPRLQVLTLEWIEPVMAGGLWMAELVNLAGGVPLLSEPGVKSQVLEQDELERVAPQAVLIKPCGFRLEQSLKELGTLKRTLPWRRWPAVRNGRVFIADGSAYFNRSGPRIVDSLEILAACLHPELFPEFRRAYRQAVLRVLPDLRTEPW